MDAQSQKRVFRVPSTREERRFISRRKRSRESRASVLILIVRKLLRWRSASRYLYKYSVVFRKMAHLLILQRILRKIVCEYNII